MKGAFITFEGGEGSGKSTQLKLLEEYLQNSSTNYVFTREPGGTEISEKIRNLVLSIDNKTITDECEALLYSASRAQLVNELILPSINSGKIVVCDRYVDSSFVYQGIARGLGLDFVEKINSYAIDNCMPSVTIFLEITPEEAFIRKGGADKTDRLEMSGLEFHKKVYDGYIMLAKKYPERIAVIDGRGTPKETHEKILTVLREKGIIQ